MHERDPFGDEHNGVWFLYAKGSGVWYNIGTSITFPDHPQAFSHFGVRDNEAMSRAAAAAGFDTIQFTSHPDSVNYPCAAQGQYPYMNIEILGAKLQGTFSCGSSSKPDFNVLRSGWADKPCDCDNSIHFSNCGRQLGVLGRPPAPANVTAAPLPPADCSASVSKDPPWFDSCGADFGCVRVRVATNISSLVLEDGALGPNRTAGYLYCIDHTNLVVYAKISGEPSDSVALFKATDDATGHSCQFLAHHWVDGDLVRVYNQSGVGCVVDWTQLPGVNNITQATLKFGSAPPLPPPPPKPCCSKASNDPYYCNRSGSHPWPDCCDSYSPGCCPSISTCNCGC